MFTLNKQHLGWLAFSFVCFIWGTNFISMKLATMQVSPLQTVLLRVLFGFIPLVLCAIYQRQLAWSHWRYAHHFLVMSLLATSIYYFGFAQGASMLGSGVAGAISGAIPLFSLIAAILFLKDEAITRLKVLGTIVGFVGVVILARPLEASTDGNNTFTGACFMMLGAFSVGISFVYAKRFVLPLQLSPLALTTYQLGFALFTLLLITDTENLMRITDDSLTLFSTVVGLGILGTGVAYLCYYYIIATHGALVAASSTFIPPIIALAIGTFIVNEPITLQDYVGACIILVAVGIIFYSNWLSGTPHQQQHLNPVNETLTEHS